jgi:hypothetical protein
MAEEAIPKEVPSSRAVLKFKYSDSRESKRALFLVIPAVFAIADTFLLLLLKTRLPAPKSVTLRSELFFNNSLLY